MGFYWWDKPESNRRSREEMRRGRASSDYEPTKMPIEAGYWDNYGWRVLASGVSAVGSGLILFFYASDFAYLGAGAPLYFMMMVIFLVTSVYLPIHWGLEHRRMQSIYEDFLEEEQQEELPE